MDGSCLWYDVYVGGQRSPHKGTQLCTPGNDFDLFCMYARGHFLSTKNVRPNRPARALQMPPFAVFWRPDSTPIKLSREAEMYCSKT